MDCPVCASSRTEPLATPRRSFHRCRTCGFSWADPSSRPDPAAARSRYALHRNDPDDPGYRAYMEGIVDRALAWAGEGVTPGSMPRTAVDWGSGPEPLCADLLRGRGLEVTAWDPYFRPEAPPAPRSADLALCIEVAEHFFDPAADFTAFALRLKAGGRALVHTHLAPEDDGAFLKWWYIEDPTHVSFYSRRSLEIVADYAGLCVPRFEGGRFCLLRRPLPVLVAGGANLDIEGRPAAALVERDSNPGTVTLSPGGAGRNIAENLAALGVAVELVAAVGSDGAGRDLLETTAERGVGTSGSVALAGEGTSMYLSILDGEGDMALALSGMGIYDAFGSKEILAGAERAAAAALAASYGADADSPFSALVLDGNLLPEAADALLDRFPRIPAWLDPVSTAKARRFAMYRGGALLGRLFCVKPNLAEAEAMAEAMTKVDAASAAQGATVASRVVGAAKCLRGLGAETLMVSLGAEGLLRSGAEGATRIRTPEVSVVSATGAGDAALAGALREFLLNHSPTDQMLSACAAAAITLGDRRAVSPALDGRSLASLCLRWDRDGSAVVEHTAHEELCHEQP